MGWRWGLLTRTVMLLFTVLLKFPLYSQPDLKTPPPPPPPPPPPLDDERDVVSWGGGGDKGGETPCRGWAFFTYNVKKQFIHLFRMAQLEAGLITEAKLKGVLWGTRDPP